MIFKNSNLLIFVKKIVNTFLTPCWGSVYLYYNINFAKNLKNKKLFWILSKFWFLPYYLSIRYWHNAGINSLHNYNHYLSLDYKSNLLIKIIKKYSSSKNNKILDLGCNIGRHLNSLKIAGYNNLYGVDIGKIPINKSQKIFLNLKKVNMECSSFENYIYKTKNNFFDIIYTHGATIEMVKPTFPLIFQLSRILSSFGYLILLIEENGHAYPRFWRYEFKKHNLKFVYCKNVIDGQTLFVLRK
jgi:SAM-dependent methyltransferase